MQFFNVFFGNLLCAVIAAIPVILLFLLTWIFGVTITGERVWIAACVGGSIGLLWNIVLFLFSKEEDKFQTVFGSMASIIVYVCIFLRIFNVY